MKETVLLANNRLFVVHRGKARVGGSKSSLFTVGGVSQSSGGMVAALIRCPGARCTVNPATMPAILHTTIS